jgi:hypothetical protein
MKPQLTDSICKHPECHKRINFAQQIHNKGYCFKHYQERFNPATEWNALRNALDDYSEAT